MASAAYITQVRRLLHDATGNYWSDTDLLAYINEARNRIALESASIRSLVSFNLCQGVESYPFSGGIASVVVTSSDSNFTAAPTVTFTGGGGSGATASANINSTGSVATVVLWAVGTGYTAVPTVTLSGGGGTASATASILQALDILNVTVNWGNSYITLGYTYFSEFQAKARYWRNQSGQPALWSKGPPKNSTGGSDYIYIFMIPQTTFTAEADCIVLPDQLVDDTTVEQLIYPYTDLVQYYAAHLAKFKQQQFSEAEAFLRMYENMLKQYTASRYQRRVPNPYAP